eukprot:275719-Chlamydomonas_euryale.AAC.1
MDCLSATAGGQQTIPDLPVHKQQHMTRRPHSLLPAPLPPSLPCPHARPCPAPLPVPARPCPS